MNCKILDNIENMIKILEKNFDSSPEKNKIAIFDLDNTLIDGDIGDAVFTYLIKNGFITRLSWEKYNGLKTLNPEFLYVEMVRAMDGLDVDYISTLTRTLLISDLEYLAYSGEKVKIPKPNKCMQKVIQYLYQKNYTTYVISASNDISVKVTVEMFFQIPSKFVYGIKSVIRHGKLTEEIIEPAPVGPGKVQLYNLINGDIKPVLVASDSKLDLPLFELCGSGGIALVVGNNGELVEEVKRNIRYDVQILNLAR